MPRPRFERLSPEKRAHILAVATEEFADNGFEGASYNRIIERAGLSKGAMYYYFDDKSDLYGTVLQASFAEVLEMMRPPVAEGIEAFWQELAQSYLQFGALAMAKPHLVALMRGLLDHPQRHSQGPIAEMFAQIRAFTEALVDQGQRIGAVRDDLDRDLLVSVAFSVGEAVDRWSFDNIERLVGEDPEALMDRLVGLYRRLLEPRGDR